MQRYPTRIRAFLKNRENPNAQKAALGTHMAVFSLVNFVFRIRWAYNCPRQSSSNPAQTSCIGTGVIECAHNQGTNRFESKALVAFYCTRVPTDPKYKTRQAKYMLLGLIKIKPILVTVQI